MFKSNHSATYVKANIKYNVYAIIDKYDYERLVNGLGNTIHEVKLYDYSTNELIDRLSNVYVSDLSDGRQLSIGDSYFSPNQFVEEGESLNKSDKNVDVVKDENYEFADRTKLNGSKAVVFSESEVSPSYNQNDAKLVSIKKGNLECRLWNIKDYPSIRHPKAELVRWSSEVSNFVNGKDPTCYTCAIWEKDKEGWEMHSVGSRFLELFREEKSNDILNLCNNFDKLLNEVYFNEEK